MRLVLLLLIAGSLAAQTDSLLLSIDTTTVDIQTVTVRARKIRYGELATEQLSQLDVYVNPTAKADPLLAVNSLPAATNPDETANVSLRGSPSEATGVYLNDVPLRSAVRLDQTNNLGQFSIFGQIPMERIQVYAAHPPVSYSQSSAGAVALYTGSERPRSPSHSVSLNLVGAGYSHARSLGKQSGLRAYVNLQDLTAFRALNGDRVRDLRSSRSVDAALQYTTRFGKQAELQAFYLGFDENYRYAVRSPNYQGIFEQRKPRHLGIVNYRFGGSRWRWSWNQLLDWERPRFAFGNIVTEPRRLTLHQALHGELARPGRTLRLGTAYNAYHDAVRGTYPLSDFELAPESPAESYTERSNHRLGEVYAYLQQRLGEDWLLGLGIKPLFGAGPQEELDQRIRLTAQAAVRYRTGAHRINLGGGRFAQYLSPGPSVPSWQWLQLDQLALEYTYEKDGWKAAAAAYAKHEAYALNPDRNVAGVEIAIERQSDFGNFWLSAASVRSKTKSDIDEGTLGRPTNLDLPFLVRGRFTSQFGAGWTVGAAATYRRGQYFLPLVGRESLGGEPERFIPLFAEENAGTRYPNYARLDLNVSKTLILANRQLLILYASLGNTLDRRNVAGYSYDASYTERESLTYGRRVIFFGGVLQWR